MTAGVFYVYIHRRASDGLPFYVGKGSGIRHKIGTKWQRSKRWLCMAEKHGWYSEIAQSDMDLDSVYLLEMWLIAKFLHEGMPLVNITMGGGGGRRGIKPVNVMPINCSNGMRFIGATEAVEYLKSIGVSGDAVNINSCAAGKHNSAYGFTWWRDGDAPREYIDPKDRRAKSFSVPVKTECGLYFASMVEAEDFLRIKRPTATKSGICPCCKGKRDSYLGYKWSYA